MATSPVEIVNLALDKLHEDQIASLSDDAVRGNKLARRARDAYPHVRDLVLEQYPWKCATVLVELPADAEVPPAGYAYFHTPPEGYLRFIGPYDAGEDVRSKTTSEKPWDVGTNAAGEVRLMSNENPIVMWMIRRVEVVGRFPNTLVEAIASKLAMQIAPEKSRKDRAERDFGFAIRDAKRTNAIQQAGEVFVASGWTDAAYGYGPTTPPRIGPIVGA